MVTALDRPSDRVTGLDAGADDFLTKPVSDLVLIARVQSLARLKMMTDELRMRAVTSREIGLENPAREAVTDDGRGAHVLIVDDRPSSYERMAQTLAEEHTVDVEVNPRQAVFQVADANFDLAIISLARTTTACGCAAISARSSAPATPLLAIAEPDDHQRLMRGLEIGVNDYLMRPTDRNELLARVAASATTRLRPARLAQ
jgi:two-component system cell cycle response regulator